MKLSILQEDLFKALSTVSRFISSRAQLPILSNVLLVAGNGKLRLAATNLEMGISLNLGAKVDEPGSLTVPAKMFLELVASLPSGKIDLTEDKDKLLVQSPSFSAELSGIPAVEFPQIPEKIPPSNFTLPLDVLGQIASQVSFSSSQDETRPQLTGVLLLMDEKLKAVATDGFRLSLKEFGFKGDSSVTRKFLIPARALDELTKVINPLTERVEVALLEKEGQMIFGADDVVLTGRLLEGEFPDYNRIFPKSKNHSARVGKEDLGRAVKTAAVFARESASVIKMSLDKDKVTISSESAGYGKDEAVLDAKTEGEPVSIAFNYRYVLDFLASMKGEEVLFETEAADRPGVFRDSKDDSYTHLIMPVRLPS
ncbi:MAG: DNA polymerase III subunit beta [bacterium]|nr:DNA polymerase III subunit beta [bacterium]